MDLTRTHCIDMDSWYRNAVIVQTWTHGMDIESWYRHGLMVWTWPHGFDKYSWYRHRLRVLTTPMVLTLTHGILLVLLNHTLTTGPGVAHMLDLYSYT